ncbi:MAG: ABC transporter permease, partial [Planctomycetes bacterium]|nr:ABC transporter permease [Planctomycetota bacterium]
VRTVLTFGSLVVATFLVCFLASLVTALEAGVSGNEVRRLWTQTAVSLFSSMPQSYQSKIESLPEVQAISKFQWFGGYYKEQKNFFGQFAVDPEPFLELYPEVDLANDANGDPLGSFRDFVADRRGCIVGKAVFDKYAEKEGWEVGGTLPIIGTIFPGKDGAAWEFVISAVFDAEEANVDKNNIFFHWDYFEETLKDVRGEVPEVGTFVFEPAEGADLDAVCASVDALFAGGPMRTQTTTESEFQRQFVGMIGNLPRFIAFLGFGVFVAIVLACVNTMLMAAREQTHDVGVLKALGFSDGRVFGLMLTQGMLLCGVGGGLGLLIAKASEAGFRKSIQIYFPGYQIANETLVGAAIAIVLVGLVSGAVPAFNARRMSPVEALRATV